MENKKYFVVAGEKLLCDQHGMLVLIGEPEFAHLQLHIITQHSVSLDENIHTCVVAVNIRELVDYQWLGLRTQLGLISEAEFQRAGRALQILRWHFDHQFCGRCGNPTEQHSREIAKTCSRCNLDFYPRLSPCIITLVTRGDYCLLARHVRSAQEKYSCLAGFIEAGETPEQTVVREVMEEVSVHIDNVRYVMSQAWPFPGQLMLGYMADYQSGDISVDAREILTADWFHYDELPNIPPIASISGRLIDMFVQYRKSFHTKME